MLVPTGWSTSLLLVPTLTTAWVDICHRPSLFLYYPIVVFDTMVHLSLAAGIGLQGSVQTVSSGGVYALSSTASLKYTLQLDSTHQHHHSLLPPPLWLLTTARTQFDANQKINWIPRSSSPQRLNAGQPSTGSSSYHCCNREAYRTSWNLIDAGKPAPQFTFQLCTRPFTIVLFPHP